MTNTCHDIAPPVTADIRLRRRQSLTGIPPTASTMSRRSSLGGRLDISKFSDQENSILCLFILILDIIKM